MNDHDPEATVDFIRRLVNAWDCCGTCAGGVLAARDRERDARLASVLPAAAATEGDTP